MKCKVFSYETDDACDFHFTTHIRVLDVIHIEKKNHFKRMIKSLTNVQYQTKKTITKAYKATSKKTLNIEINFILIHLRLNKLINATTIKLITNSTYETIIKNRFIKKSRNVNSLKKLMNRFERNIDIKTQNMKKIISFATSS